MIPAVIDRLSKQYPRIVFSVMQAVDLAQQYRDLRERNVDLILGRIAEPIADEDMDLELTTGRFLAVRSTSMLRLACKRSSVKVLPVDLPIRPVHIGIVTLRNRTINPVPQLFIACAREVVRPLAKRN